MRRADAQRNYDKIVRAARDVIGASGPQVPMAVVARGAGVGVGTLHRCFPDRAALLGALSEQYIHDPVDATSAARAAEPDAWHALRAIVLWCASPGRSTIASALAALPNDELTGSPAFAAARRRWLAEMEHIVRAAQDDGAMRRDVGVADVILMLTVFTCHPDERSRAARPAI